VLLELNPGGPKRVGLGQGFASELANRGQPRFVVAPVALAPEVVQPPQEFEVEPGLHIEGAIRLQHPAE
jgi:hypothetical protein